jgi:hypothetical protein
MNRKILLNWLQNQNNKRDWNISDMEKVRLGTTLFLKEDADSEFNKKIKAAREEWKTRYGRDLSEKETLDFADIFKNKGQSEANKYLSDLANTEARKTTERTAEAQRLIDDALSSAASPPPSPASPKASSGKTTSSTSSADNLRKLYTEVGDAIKRAEQTGLKVNKLTSKELNALVNAHKAGGAEATTQTLMDINQNRKGTPVPRESTSDARRATPAAATPAGRSETPAAATPARRSGVPAGRTPVGQSGVDALFGVIGGTNLPADISQMATGVNTMKNWVYDPAAVGFGGNINDRRRKGAEFAASDATRTLADAEMAILGTKGVVDLSSKVKGAKTVADLINKIPGSQMLPSIAGKILPPTMAAHKGAEAAIKLETGDVGGASREALDATHFLALMSPKTSGYGTRGVGQQFMRSGIAGLYSDIKQGEMTSGLQTAGDVASVALGAAVKDAPVWAAAKAATKEAGEDLVTKAGAKIAAKAGLKAAAKQIPLAGLGVSVPFAASRAWEGDWSGAALELASAVPIAGLGADAYLAVRDFEKELAKQQQAQLTQQSAIKNVEQKTQQPSTTKTEYSEPFKRTPLVSPGAVNDEDVDVESGERKSFDTASDEEIMSPEFLKKTSKSFANDMNESFISKKQAKALMEVAFGSTKMG